MPGLFRYGVVEGHRAGLARRRDVVGACRCRSLHRPIAMRDRRGMRGFAEMRRIGWVHARHVAHARYSVAEMRATPLADRHPPQSLTDRLKILGEIIEFVGAFTHRTRIPMDQFPWLVGLSQRLLTRSGASNRIAPISHIVSS